jgi:hypothetical protein
MSNKGFLANLRTLNALAQTNAIRYKTIAQKLNINPVSKKTGKPLKDSSIAYKDFIKSVVNTLATNKRAELKSKHLKEISNTNKNSTKLYKKPTIIKDVKLDEIKKFSKHIVHFGGVSNLRQFWEALNLMKKTTGGDNTYISVLFENLETGQVNQGRAIRASYLDDFNDFKDVMNRLKKGESITGSDPLDANEYEMIYDKVIYGNYKSSIGFGSSKDMIFEVVGIGEKEKDKPLIVDGLKEPKTKGKSKLLELGTCAYDCIKYCGFEYTGNKLDLADYHKLVSYIIENDLPINVVGNTFKTITDRKTLFEKRNANKQKIMIKNAKGFDILNVSIKLELEDIVICYLYQCPQEAKYTILFDDENEHYDIIKNNELTLCKDVFYTLDGNVIKDNKTLFTPKQLFLNTKEEVLTTRKYVIFDYETVIDFEYRNIMKEYSLSILVLEDYELKALEKADRENDVDTVQAIRKKNCITFLGHECSYRFIDWIIANQIKTSFTFIGFNNTNFDNFLFLDALLKYQVINNSVDYSVANIFYNGSQLLNFTINGRHNTFDIHKHLVGSLKSNCESFKIKCCSKKSFDHNKAQELYLEGNLIDFITNNEELKEYNEYDVLATAVLFEKYRQALDSVECTKQYSQNITDIKTIGSLIYKVFVNNQTKLGVNLPKLSFKQYDDLQKHKIAGRVELFNGVQEVLERLASTDVCSLYPFVMAVLNVYYPCGEIVEVDSYQKDTIGFYYCDIDQSNLAKEDLPNIYAEKLPLENKWDSENILKDYLISNVMIELLLKYKCKVEIKKGFIFTKELKSCELFGFLLDLMKAKNDQDSKKSAKDETYNPALRETLKLLMNAISGKVIEGLHTEKTKDVDNEYEFLEIQKKAKNINCINSIGNKLFLTYEVDAESLINQQRPIYLGVLIYDYAKRYMYENSYSKIGKSKLLYTDTDASKFRYKDFLTWEKDIVDNNRIVPHWKEIEQIDPRYKNHLIYERGSKVFGSFEDELEEYTGSNYRFFCLEKKSWMYAWTNKEGKRKDKYRFKGLNGSAQILTLKEDFISFKINKKGVVKFFVEEDSELDVYTYYNAHKENNIEAGNTEKFFETIKNKGEAYVLTQSFRKIVKNSARNVDVGDNDKFNELLNKIQVNISMKKISINKVQELEEEEE